MSRKRYTPEQIIGTLRPPRLAIGPGEVEKMVQEILPLDIPGIPPLPKKAS